MKIILLFLFLIMSNYTNALECTTEKGKDAYNHLIYVIDGGNGSYSVIFPKLIEEREFSSATLFINSKEMTFINDVKVIPKEDELTFSFLYQPKTDSSFSAEASIVWKNKNININIQCPIVALKKLN